MTQQIISCNFQLWIQNVVTNDIINCTHALLSASFTSRLSPQRLVLCGSLSSCQGVTQLAMYSVDVGAMAPTPVF